MRRERERTQARAGGENRTNHDNEEPPPSGRILEFHFHARLCSSEAEPVTVSNSCAGATVRVSEGVRKGTDRTARKVRTGYPAPVDRIERMCCKVALMPDFKLEAPFKPTGDQPQAIERLTSGLAKGLKFQTLLGATGTGKTMTAASVIEQAQKPTLVLCHNKTLAAQLYCEFREFFPSNAVEYFVSYFDYYQPEAYLPRSDTYIEKDSSRNDEIDKLRHAATRALFERRDTIIVASVSCIYGLGAPVDYGATVVRLREGGRTGATACCASWSISSTSATTRSCRVPASASVATRSSSSRRTTTSSRACSSSATRSSSIVEIDPLTGEVLAERKELNVYPASHYVTPAEKMSAAIVDIEKEMEERVEQLRQRGMELEAERLRQRTTFDLEMMRELGFCSGIENYSRHLAAARGRLAAVDAARLLPAGLAADRRRERT